MAVFEPKIDLKSTKKQPKSAFFSIQIQSLPSNRHYNYHFTRDQKNPIIYTRLSLCHCHISLCDIYAFAIIGFISFFAWFCYHMKKLTRYIYLIVYIFYLRTNIYIYLICIFIPACVCIFYITTVSDRLDDSAHKKIWRQNEAMIKLNSQSYIINSDLCYSLCQIKRILPACQECDTYAASIISLTVAMFIYF